MSVIKNNGGFSLPEIVIAIGLLGGISLVTMKLMEEQADNKAHLVAKAEIQKATALLKATLNNPENCRYMLRDQIVPSALNTPENIINPGSLPAVGLYLRINTGAYKELLIPGGNYGKFRVGTIRLQRTSANIGNMGNIELLIQYGVEKKSIIFKSDNNINNDRTYLHKIPLTVTTDSSSRIKDCGTVVSDANIAARQKFCESLGNMAWWNTSVTPNRCEFRDLRCSYGLVPHKQDSSMDDTIPVYECVPITDKFDASDLFDETACTSSTGKYSIQSSGGKLRVACH